MQHHTQGKSKPKTGSETSGSSSRTRETTTTTTGTDVNNNNVGPSASPVPRASDRTGRRGIRVDGGPSQRTKSPVGAPPPPGIPKTLNLTKRGVAVAPADEVRRRENAARDMDFVKDIHAKMFKDGRLVGDPTQVYTYIRDKLGYGPPGYMKTPITREEVAELEAGAEKGGYTVTNQLSVQPTNPVPMDAALAIGDYVGFIRDPLPAQEPGPNRRQRRLAVNVTNQKAALRVTRALLPLFKKPGLEKFFSEVKVFLSTGSNPTTPVKNDKLVVYYGVGPERADAADYVGDQLVDTINGTLKPGDVDDAQTPFYSELTPAISWAEDPQDFIPKSPAESFTESRARAISLAIKHTQKSQDTFDTPDDLMKLIRLAFTFYGISAAQPHRHLPPSPEKEPDGTTSGPEAKT
ncbi:hypothetical protein J5X84_43445 [Streptosporangiaceae bacterium NEAU-GS5]|nr:hypothetical protein [Streptosporangiaceae bacterium NEAU-GS5]